MKTRRSIEALELVGAAYGVDTSNVVALMATVIRGIGGRGNELNLGAHICPEPGMQIGVVRDPGYVSSILDHLLAPVRKIQRNLTEQFGRIDPVILEQAWRGSQEGDLVGSVADDGERVDRRFHLRALLGESSEQNGLMGELNGNTDFEPDLIYRRLEFILRPRFLVENARIGQLQKELGGCHVGRGPLAVEVPLTEDIEGLPVPLTGMVDLVTGDMVAVDFKSAATSPNPRQAAFDHEIQMVVYQLLIERASGRTPKSLDLIFLVKTKEPKVIRVSSPPADKARVLRVIELLRTAVDGMADGRFHPQPGMHCSWCPYRNECAKWPANMAGTAA